MTSWRVSSKSFDPSKKIKDRSFRRFLLIKYSTNIPLLIISIAIPAGLAGSASGQVPPPDENAPFVESGKAIFLKGGTIPPPMGGPVWVGQGPGPTINGQIENVTPDNEVAGAVQTLIAHPTDPDILYAGTVNGGVWRTLNATDLRPYWTPQTDLFPSLSIGALDLDPTDSTHNTLLAGIGRFSSFGLGGGPRMGMLRTTDGGESWNPIDGGGTLIGQNISGVVSRGNILLCSVNLAESGDLINTGVFRSNDAGTSFTQISNGDGSLTGLPVGPAPDIAGDPTNPFRLYTGAVAVPSTGGEDGIYRSEDSGATWENVSDATMENLIQSGMTSNIEISVGSLAEVYVAINNFGQTTGLFRSGNLGASWLEMDLPVTHETGGDFGVNPRPKEDGSPAGQGSIHFSILADPLDPNIVYVGGDRQPHANEGIADASFEFPNSIGAMNFSGRLFRGDSSAPSGNQWVHLTHSNSLGPPGGGTANNSAPHADSREMVIDANGCLIESDDGGIYRRTNPRDNTGDWFSVNGNLRVTEFHDIAYDTNTNTIVGGTQDNGTIHQTSIGSIPWDFISGGDGGDVAIEDFRIPGSSTRYTSFQFLAGFRKRVYDSESNLVSEATPALFITSENRPLNNNSNAETLFVTPLAVNRTDPNRLVIGTSQRVYESFDQGETLSIVGEISGNFGQNTMVYGGMRNGQPNANVLYVGTRGDVRVRTTFEGPLSLTPSPYPGEFVFDIAVDPDDWMKAYVADRHRVFQTKDAGGNWQEITGNLTNVGILRTIEVIPRADGNGLWIVVGAEPGVFVTSTAAPGIWNELGTNLPNAPVWDMDYDPTDDVLVIATLGRGAWLLPEASNLGRPIAFGPNDLILWLERFQKNFANEDTLFDFGISWLD